MGRRRPDQVLTVEVMLARTRLQVASTEAVKVGWMSNPRTFTFEAPMRPLDVARNMYLDYSAVQSIKFYNKGVEKLPGEAFNGKLLLTWLIQVQDKANM